MIGKWIENHMEGLAIFVNSDKKEQIWKFNKDKVQKIYSEDAEIDQLKSSTDYKQLKNFYFNLDRK